MKINWYNSCKKYWHAPLLSNESFSPHQIFNFTFVTWNVRSDTRLLTNDAKFNFLRPN